MSEEGTINSSRSCKKCQQKGQEISTESSINIGRRGKKCQQKMQETSIMSAADSVTVS